MTNLMCFIDLSGVNLTLWIISQVFAFFALVTIVYTMIFSKTKIKTLIFVICYNVLMLLSTVMLANWLLVGIYSVAVVRDLVFIWREKKYPSNKNLAIATLFTFLIISVTVSCFTISWNLSALFLALAVTLQLLSLFVIYGAWAKGVHKIRISRFVFGILAILNHIVFRNYVAILIYLFSTASIIVFYIRYFRKKRYYVEADKVDISLKQ